MTDIRISSIQFAEEGVSIAFIDMDNAVRAEGNIVRHEQFDLNNDHPDYREAIEKLHKRAVRMVEDAMEDWTTSIPFTPSTPDDDDRDEPGMGE